jgi:hypothetical protein
LFLIGYIEKNSGLNFSKRNPDFLNIRVFEVLKGCTELEVGICIRTYIYVFNIYASDMYAYIYLDILHLYRIYLNIFYMLIHHDNDDNDDVYFRLQYGKGFHNLVYMSYVKHINLASKA